MQVKQYVSSYSCRQTHAVVCRYFTPSPLNLFHPSVSNQDHVQARLAGEPVYPRIAKMGIQSTKGCTILHEVGQDWFTFQGTSLDPPFGISWLDWFPIWCTSQSGSKLVRYTYGITWCKLVRVVVVHNRQVFLQVQVGVYQQP